MFKIFCLFIIVLCLVKIKTITKMIEYYKPVEVILNKYSLQIINVKNIKYIIFNTIYVFQAFCMTTMLWKSKFHMCLIAAIAHSFLAAFFVVPVEKINTINFFELLSVENNI